MAYAADTKSSIANTAKIFSETKIHQTKNIFYAVLGAYKAGPPNNHYYDSYKIMNDVILKNNGITNSYKAINDAILKRLNYVVDSLRSKKSFYLINDFVKRGGILEFVMASVENGKPNYYTNRYLLQSLQGKVVDADASHYDKKDGDVLIRKGKVMHINEFLKNTPIYLKTKDRIKERLICLIKIQADKDIPNVSMPADVVAIYKNNHKWDKGKKDCVIR